MTEIPSSAATTGASSVLLLSPSDHLSSLTIPKLKDFIKESGWNEKGMSKLKRKQDLIDFILEKQEQHGAETLGLPSLSEPGNGIINGGSSKRKNGAAAAATKPKMVSMPRPTKLQQAASSATITFDDPNRQQLNPMEVLSKKLYERYPPLKHMRMKKNKDHGDEIDAESDDADPMSSPTANLLLTHQITTGLGEQDFRQRYHPMLRQQQTTTAHDQPVLSGDMDLIFVGTASCTPSVTRGVSCTALRLLQRQTKTQNSGTWLFDCGESTQLQVQRTSSIKPSKITKIFLTHAHGDHTFGLPGLLCLMGQDHANSRNDSNDSNAKQSNRNNRNNSQGPKVIDIYGPEGLRMWLRVAIRYSVSRIVPPYRVHELKDIPMAPEWTYSRRHQRYFYNLNNEDQQHHNIWGVPSEDHHGNDASSWAARHHQIDLEPSSLYGEVEGGRDIYPHYDHPLSSDGAPIWQVEDEGDVKVYAAPMSHGIPCVGFAVQEEDRPGRLRDEVVRPVIERNHDAMKDAGFRHPLKAMQAIKELAPGSSFTFPDGTVISQEEAVEAPRTGRKVVICGDTASARSMTKLADGADVVVHEATNTFLHGFDKDTNMKAVTKDAMVHGHSTPRMAGTFAKDVGAKRLIMNHFSARYRGDATLESIATMTRMEEQALKISGMKQDQVAAAWDFMIYPIPLEESRSEDESEGGY